MNKNAIIGAMCALVTPFKSGKLDEQTYQKLIKRQIANGIDTVSLWERQAKAPHSLTKNTAAA